MIICCDCNEAVVESERRSVRRCAGCGGALHSECSMMGVGEVDNCEACHTAGASQALQRDLDAALVGLKPWQRKAFLAGVAAHEKLAAAVPTDPKVFWKLLRMQGFSRQEATEALRAKGMSIEETEA